MRWGDSADLDDEVGDFEMALPAPQVRDRERSSSTCRLFPSAHISVRRKLAYDRPPTDPTPPRPPPPSQIIGPDANGVKTVIEYRQKEDGSKVRVDDTTTQP